MEPIPDLWKKFYHQSSARIFYKKDMLIFGLILKLLCVHSNYTDNAFEFVWSSKNSASFR